MASERKVKWYDPNSIQPLWEVEGSKSKPDHKVMVTPTLQHARKFGLLPSVTSVLGELGNYGLEQWKIGQILKACIAFPLTEDLTGKPPNEVEDIIEKYGKMISAKASEFSDFAADRGKQVHAYVERTFEGKSVEVDAVAQRVVDQIAEKFSELGVVEVRTEVSFGSRELGFAGQPDLDCLTADGGEIICDLKTTTLAKFTKPYESWLLQGGGYRRGTKKKPGCRFLQIVADRDTGDCVFPEHEDTERWELAWDHLLELFFLLKGYDPRKAEAPVA